MLLVTVDGDNEIIQAIEVVREGAPRAIVRGLNRAIQAARTSEVRNISADTGLKASDVRNALTMKQAYMGSFEASLAAGVKRVPLLDFKARGPEPSRGKGRGVSYAMQGGRETIPSAFIATMRSGHRGVFARKGAARLPIKELFGPSIGKVFMKFRGEAIARAEEVFRSRFEHEVSFQGPPVPQDLASDADA